MKIQSAIRVLCGLLLAVAGLWAQSAAVSQISGTVRDASGLGVEGAEVRVTQTDTGVTRSVQSSSSGQYILQSLPIGPYRLEVTKPGFNTFVQSGIILQVNTNPTIDAALQVGSVSEKVVVEAAAAMVETHSNGIGQVVDQQRVVDLPLNGRQATQLITLAGAATALPAANLGQLNSGKNYPGEVVISVAGGPANGLSFLLDGGTFNDPINNANLPIPFPDALQEFKVETSALPAQYGHHSAGAVNAVTKSGTNEIHGNAFEFVRNGNFNARDFFALTRDSLKRNQFGGTVGGPIQKNKLFYFLGFQATTLRSNPTTGISFIPTPQMLSGDFTTIASSTCQPKAVTLKAPFSGNKIPIALLNKAALKMTSFYGTTSDPCGRVQFGALNNLTEEMGLGRIDYQLSTNHSIFARYFASHVFQPPSYTGTPLSITASSPDGLVQSFVFGDTYVLGPSTINSFHGTFNRSAIIKTQVPFFGAADLGITGITELIPSFLFVQVTGALYSAALQTNPGALFTDSHQFANDFSMVRGEHQMQFGVNYIRPIQNAIINFNTAGGFTFTGQNTGLPMADFLVGQPATFNQQNISQDLERHQYLGLYAQDTWRLTHRLTLNYGIRWEPYFGASMQHGWVSHFDRALFDQNVHSTQYVNAPAGVLYPGDPGFNTNNRPNYIRWNDFAPRAGIVWDPRGDGKMTLRASWGRFYDLPHTLFFYNYSTESPWGANITINNPQGGFSNPWLGYPGGNPFPVVLNKNVTFPDGGYQETVPLDLKVTYLQQWNLSVQKQLGTNWLASVSYLGNNTIHLWTDQEQNPAVYIPGASCVLNGVTYTPCSSTGNTLQRRVLSLANPSQGRYINALELLDDGGTASYNALLLSLQHRFAKHFTVLGNYTWAHCIGDPVTTALSGPVYTNPADRRADRGNCAGTDIRHNVNLSVVAQSPKFSGRFMQAVAGDWQLSVIGVARSGIDFAVTTGVDNALTGIGNQRPNQVLSDPYCTTKSLNCWLNPSAFVAPATGTRGNMGIYNLAGPGYFDIDLGLSRMFPVTERQRVEIRAEAFNVQNRTNLANPTASLNSSTFGKILSDISPRIMQFAIKYQF